MGAPIVRGDRGHFSLANEPGAACLDRVRGQEAEWGEGTRIGRAGSKSRALIDQSLHGRNVVGLGGRACGAGAREGEDLAFQRKCCQLH
jgi:hypothetical protein